MDGPAPDGRAIGSPVEPSGHPSGNGVPEVERFVTDRGSVLRLNPWRGDSRTSQVVAVGGPAPQADDVARLLDHLNARGVHTVVTAALGSVDQQPFAACGFTPHEHLLLLHQILEPNDLPSRGARTRPAHRRDQDAVLDLDGRAFAPFSAFWRFDAAALDEAERATGMCRRRVVRRRPDGRFGSLVTGHAVTGRTASIGFLQRLAVDPAAEGRGIGSALVVDALRWLGHTGAREVWVNTQPDNERARSLYLRHGFTERGAGLDVLRRSIDTPAGKPIR